MNVLKEWAPIVSSYVPAAALVYAVWKGRAELNRWRHERRETKRADTAAAALVASIRFSDGLKQIASPFFFGGEPPPTHAEETEQQTSRRELRELSERLGERWQNFATTKNEFIAAWEHAQVYLEPDATALLEELWLAGAKLRASQQTYVMTSRGSPASDQLFDDALGTDIPKKIEAILEKVRAKLRPLAQLQGKSG